MKFEKLLEFLEKIGRLKKIERTGWVVWKGLNVKNPESVAEHVFRAAILGMILADLKKLKSEKVIKMILLHDLPEALIGDWDLTAKKKLGIERWKRKEKDAMKNLMSLLGKIGKEYLKLWKEFEEQKSKEAKIAKQAEKLEMIIQAYEYMKEGYPKRILKDWFINEEKIMKDKDVRKMFELVKRKAGIEKNHHKKR